MGEELGTLAEVAVSLLIAAAVIVVMYQFMGYGKQLVNARNAEQMTAMRNQEYREYHSYDNKSLHCQDIVSMVIESRNKYKVQIVDVYTYDSSSTPASEYTSNHVFSRLNVDKMYRSELVRNSAGSIIGYKVALIKDNGTWDFKDPVVGGVTVPTFN